MKKITLLISAMAFVIVGFSQNNEKRSCGTTQAMQELRAQNPEAYDAQKAIKEQELQNWIANNYDPHAKAAVIRIPVVVQIWENTSTVSDAKVTEQLETLNNDFRRNNTDASNTPAVFSAVDCKIEFCLAIKDPNGNTTTGIIRKTVGGAPAGQGGSDLWNTDKYLNLFVYSIGGGTLGYTYVPSQFPNNAVHIDYHYFGNTSSAPYNKGRTATHEVGHWLNLEHIWGDANCGDDLVSDTPPQEDANGGCPSHPYNVGACSGNTTGEMTMNYMDYTNDVCMNAFTDGQKTRMIAAINTYRSDLLTASGTRCDASTGTEIFSTQLNNVFVYPNPSVGVLNIDLNEKANYTVTILNMLGEVISSQTKNAALFTFDINNQPNGVYFVRITSGDKVTTKKVFLTK